MKLSRRRIFPPLPLGSLFSDSESTSFGAVEVFEAVVGKINPLIGIDFGGGIDDDTGSLDGLGALLPARLGARPGSA